MDIDYVEVEKIPEKLVPWVEKYRPRRLSDVAAQNEVVNALKSALETGQVPHLLFYGPPGTGKTSTIVAMAKELYGSEFRKRVLELNASDERGISVVRDKVKVFASTAVASGSNGADRKLPPFKLIILDESDSMSQDAQSALRRTMELYTRVTRFCLICNYVSRIIDPLASRCAKFRFEPLPPQCFIDRINFIAKKEQIELDPQSMDTLVHVSKGDLRAGITLLQASSQYSDKNLITAETILELSGLPTPEFISSVWKCMRSRKFSDLTRCADDLQAEGFSAASVLKILQDELLTLNDEKMTEMKKAVILQRFAAVDCAMIEGASEDLQFQALISFMTKTYHND